jgi:hypothetical protein
MHRRPLIALLALLPVLLALAVGDAGTRPPAPPQDDASELALMMRAMAAHVDSAKASIGRGARLPHKPDFSGLFTATPTEGMHIDPITFPTFGQDYLRKLDALYKARRKDRTKAYNALVLSCANCHGTHCPGPLMRINRMYLPVAE